MPDTPHHDIVVVGASMDGLAALKTLARNLPADLRASVFIIRHIAAESSDELSGILNRIGPLPADQARDGQPIEPGRIYVAPPDRHTLLVRGEVRVVRGPRENRWRPAIDPLFRSAAAAYATRVIGVVLTGMLDDGTAGMMAVKRCGGLAVVQDPGDASYPDMPRNVIERVEVDHVVPMAEMGSLLARLVREPAPPPPEIPEDILAEVRLMTGSPNASETPPPKDHPENLVALSCPECGGPLSSVGEDSIDRYRCQVGHAFTAVSLLADQSEAVERALWAAVRILDERVALLKKLATDSRRRGHTRSVAGYEDRAGEAGDHARTIRRLLTKRRDESDPEAQAEASPA